MADFEFKMPSLGADMTEGILTAWNVEVGDTVESGDVICEVETNKGDIDVEIWESGTVRELRVEPGEKLPVGEVLAVLDTADKEQGQKQQPEEPKQEPAKEPEEPTKQPPKESSDDRRRPPTRMPDAADMRVPEGIVATPAARRRSAELGLNLESIAGTGVEGSVTADDVEQAHRRQEPSPEQQDPGKKQHPRVTPVARRMARKQGVDLDELTGSGPHGAIRREDVEAALEHGETRRRKPDERRDPMEGMREAIATAMARSKREIPHYYLHETIPMTRPTEWVADYNAERPPSERLLVGVLVLKAVALACREFPEMNGFFEDDRFRRSDDINPGFAISMRQGGVIPPAVHNADEKSVSELMDDVRNLVERVRRGKLRSSQVTDATITLTSLGELGVEAVYGVIYPPQVAIVGVGRITERVFAEENMIGTRPTTTMTLSGDHRVSDGIAGARFLSTIAELLQCPEEL